MVSAMRTRSLCLRPYHMERGTVAGSRMRLCAHKRRSHARVGAWTYDYTTELSATPCWNLSMIPRARVLIMQRSVLLMRRSVLLMRRKVRKKGTDNRTDFRWGFQVPEYYPWAEEENVHFHSRYRAGGE